MQSGPHRDWTALGFPGWFPKPWSGVPALSLVQVTTQCKVQSFLLETSKKSKPWSGNVRPELHFAVWSRWSGPGYGVGARGRGSGEASSTRCVIFARLGGLQGFPGEVFASIREAPTELSEPWRPNRVQQVEGLPGPGVGRRSAGPARLGALASKNSVQETDPRRRGFERRW